MDMNLLTGGQMISNGGNVANTLAANNYDLSSLRPYMEVPDGPSLVTRVATHNVMTGESTYVVAPTVNAATLTHQSWQQIDSVVIDTAQKELTVVADLEARGLVYNLPNALGKSVLISQMASDVSDADLSMDARRQTAADRQEFDTSTLPLPIAHKDFHFGIRELNAVNTGEITLDTRMIRESTKKVAAVIEQLALGTYGTYAFGGGNIYGLANHGDINTKSQTTPTGANGPVVFVEILDMIAKAVIDNHRGPYVIYAAPSWEPFLDADYSNAKGEGSLRDRILKIGKVQDVLIADHMTTKTMLLVQTTNDVVEIVSGIDFVTVEWDSLGGMEKNFKVMAMKVPRVRSDFDGQSGIVLGTYT